jgi:predicted nucleic-acid-binding protein
MIRNVFLDTNIIIRYFLNDNKSLSPIADEIFTKIKKGLIRAHLTKYIIIEVVFILLSIYSIPRKEIIVAIRDLLNIKGITIEDKEVIFKCLDIFSHTNLSIVDSMLIADASHLNYDIETFDKELNKIYQNNINKVN